MSRPAVVIHLPVACLLGQEHVAPYFHKLRDGLEARRIEVEIEALERDGFIDRIGRDENFHIVNHGDFRHPRVLNTASAYIAPFWYLDPVGIRRHSSIAAKTFDPAGIDPSAAMPSSTRCAAAESANGLRAIHNPKRRRKCRRRHRGLPAKRGRCRYRRPCRPRRDDRRTSGAPAASPIVIKPHPRDTGDETADLIAAAARDPRVRVTGISTTSFPPRVSPLPSTPPWGWRA